MVDHLLIDPSWTGLDLAPNSVELPQDHISPDVFIAKIPALVPDI
jgi:hypothetical protein